MDGDLHVALSRFVLEHHREAVVVLDRDARVVDANAAARSGELDLVAALAAPERDARIHAFLDELAVSGHAFTLVASKTGSVYRLEGTAVESLKVIVARELSRDTDAKSVLGPVAATFIHDFNNLLMPIMLLAGRLGRDLERGSEAAMMASEIQASASVAASLARDLLAIARPRTPVTERVDVNELLVSIERLIRRLAGPSVEVLFALADDTALETRIDRKTLEHAVLTLVVRARDAMPEGGHLAISTALVEQGGVRHVAISLTDTGSGAASADASEFAHGIDGLTVVFDGASDRGTNATLLLDAVTPSASGIESTRTASEIVLVVERDDRLRRAIRSVLTGRGFHVVTATTQEEAIDAATAHRIGVAVLDATVFQRSPSTFLQQLRALGPSMRLVVLSDHDLGDAAPSCVTTLAKPFGDEALVSAVGGYRGCSPRGL